MAGRLIGVRPWSSAALCVLAGCAGSSDTYTGKLRVNDHLQYEMVEVASRIGGQCEGWNKVLMSDPSKPHEYIDDLLCWRELPGDPTKIEVNTREGYGRMTHARALLRD